MINQKFFPNTPASFFWTSSMYAGAPGNAWRVPFGYGNTSYYSVDTLFRFRCVRSPAPKCYPTRYEVQPGGLVLDRTTGLTWQQAVDAGWFLSTSDDWVEKYYDPNDLRFVDRTLFGGS